MWSFVVKRWWKFNFLYFSPPFFGQFSTFFFGKFQLFFFNFFLAGAAWQPGRDSHKKNGTYHQRVGKVILVFLPDWQKNKWSAVWTWHLFWFLGRVIRLRIVKPDLYYKSWYFGRTHVVFFGFNFPERNLSCLTWNLNCWHKVFGRSVLSKTVIGSRSFKSLVSRSCGPMSTVGTNIMNSSLVWTNKPTEYEQRQEVSREIISWKHCVLGKSGVFGGMSVVFTELDSGRSPCEAQKDTFHCVDVVCCPTLGTSKRIREKEKKAVISQPSSKKTKRSAQLTPWLFAQPGWDLRVLVSQTVPQKGQYQICSTGIRDKS